MDREQKIEDIMNIMTEVINKDEMHGDMIRYGLYYVPFTSCAESLCNNGYSKIVWHKVADNDLPKYPTFYFCHYKGVYINSGEPYEADHEMYWNGKRFITDSTNKVIAWTEIPSYEEKQ